MRGKQQRVHSVTHDASKRWLRGCHLRRMFRRAPAQLFIELTRSRYLREAARWIGKSGGERGNGGRSMMEIARDETFSDEIHM